MTKGKKPAKAERAPESRPIRLDKDTVTKVKVASALAGETMQAWLKRAVDARLEREGKQATGDRRRVASVTFDEGGV